MSIDKDQINPMSPDDDLEKFSNLSVPWRKSREEVWAGMFENLDEKKEARVVPIYSPWMKWGIAASLLLLLSVGPVFWLYQTNVSAIPGQHRIVALPDGSQVTLNAGSSLQYKPLLWSFSRKVDFEGEAYFDIAQGSRFEIISENGTTTIHGTSFNIYARNNQYKVTCLTGIVEVADNHGNKVMLEANEKVVLSSEGLIKQKNANAAQDKAWTDYQFVFTGRPLFEVMEEIERQYAVHIELADPMAALTYTGNFSSKRPVEETIDLICAPFGLKFVNTKTGHYRLETNE